MPYKYYKVLRFIKRHKYTNLEAIRKHFYKYNDCEIICQELYKNKYITAPIGGNIIPIANYYQNLTITMEGEKAASIINWVITKINTGFITFIVTTIKQLLPK